METVNDARPTPAPRPGPSGPDVDTLRTEFDDLLADSAPGSGSDDDPVDTVADHQVEALDAAHELLAHALGELDSTR